MKANESSQKSAVREILAEYDSKIEGIFVLEDDLLDEQLPYKTTEGSKLEVAFDDGELPLRIEGTNGFEIADGLYLEAFDAVLDITKVKGSCCLVLSALHYNRRAAIAADDQDQPETAFHYVLRVAELFGMFAATSKLPDSHIYWYEKMESRIKSDGRNGRQSDTQKEIEKGMIKAKYFELYDREGKEPSAPRIARIMRPSCTALKCSEQQIGKWIRGEKEKGIAGWRSEYATTQLEK